MYKIKKWLNANKSSKYLHFRQENELMKSIKVYSDFMSPFDLCYKINNSDLFVCNLPFFCTNKLLKQLFS